MEVWNLEDKYQLRKWLDEHPLHGSAGLVLVEVWDNDNDSLDIPWGKWVAAGVDKRDMSMEEFNKELAVALGELTPDEANNPPETDGYELKQEVVLGPWRMAYIQGDRHYYCIIKIDLEQDVDWIDLAGG